MLLSDYLTLPKPDAIRWRFGAISLRSIGFIVNKRLAVIVTRHPGEQSKKD